jgi:hypothetical protein
MSSTLERVSGHQSRAGLWAEVVATRAGVVEEGRPGELLHDASDEAIASIDSAANDRQIMGHRCIPGIMPGMTGERP